MGKVAFWIVWVLEVIGFVFLAGCFVLLLSYNKGGVDREALPAFVLLGVAAAGMVFGLYLAVRAFQRGESAGQIALKLSIAPAIVFLAFGACMIAVQI